MVDVAIDILVEGVGAAGRQEAAHHGPQDEPAARRPRRSQEHGHKGDDEQEQDNARLRQHDVVADRQTHKRLLACQFRLG